MHFHQEKQLDRWRMETSVLLQKLGKQQAADRGYSPCSLCRFWL